MLELLGDWGVDVEFEGVEAVAEGSDWGDLLDAENESVCFSYV